MSQSSGFTDELDSVLDRDSVSDNGAEHEVGVSENETVPAEASSTKQTDDECTHPVIFNSMCATCFKHIEEGPGDSTLVGGTGDAKVDLRYLGIRVSQNHLKEQSEQQERHLLRQKKLVIVFDLDHTLLHTELKSRLHQEAIEQIQRMRHSQEQQPVVETEQPPTPDTNAASNTDQNASPQEETPSRKRPRDAGTTASHPTVAEPAVPSYATVYDNGDSYTKLRPGVFEMLEALRHRCELRIFTMGNPQYACAMASLIDSSGALFRNRIVARDDADPAWRCKGLQKAGAMPALTAIIDDTVDVWRPELANLIRVPRYHFFLPDGRSVADLAADEDPRNGPLATITRLLLDVHARFFGTAPPASPPAAAAAGSRSASDAAADSAVPAREAEAAGVREAPPDAAVPASGGDRPAANGPGQGAAAAAADAEPPADDAAFREREDNPGAAGLANSGAPGAEEADKSPDNGRPAEAEAGANGRPADERRALEPCPQQGVARISPEKSDVRRILEDMRRHVLHGCVIVFSRVFDNSMRAAPEQHSLWQLALALGARCSADIEAGTTHLVTLSCSTDKARTALRQHAKLVSPDWLIACECAWARLLEEDFPAPAPEVAYTLWRQAIGAEHIQALKLRGAV